jgi:DNA-binding phage protein
LDNEQLQQLHEKITNGETKTQIAKEFNISRETLYQYLRANNVA